MAEDQDEWVPSVEDEMTLEGFSEEELEADDMPDVMPPSDYIERNTSEDGTPDFRAAEREFLADVRKWYKDDISAEELNREAMVEDFKFVAGDQWDTKLKARRQRKRKPTLTINNLPAYVGTVLGNRRLNEAAIKVLPDTGGDKKIAEIRQGLIRSIEKQSRAKAIYNCAHQNQVIGGDGAFMLELVYADDDVFEQDIRLKKIPNAMSVVWDRMSVEDTGADAGHVFVDDYLTLDEFKAEFPDAKIQSFAADTSLPREFRGDGWFTNNTVRVSEVWRMRAEPRTLILNVNNKVEDVTDEPRESWMTRVAVNPETRQGYIRQVMRRYAEMYTTNGIELLDGPHVLPIKRVPVFRAKGWEVFVDERRERWGLVRFMKDPQRLKNYWRSVIAEKLMETPGATWLANDKSVEGREGEFRRSAMTDDPLLIWNSDAGTPPERVRPAQLEGALIQEANMASQDMRDVSNMHEASLGIQSNEVSGRAITARQRVGEMGTILYQDNLNAAIEEAGRVINQLIPYVYDTVRTIKVLGEDDAQDIIEVNGDGMPDITAGKYDVTIVTGPSYATKRQEAADSMLNMVNAMPQTLAIAADKIIEAQDWPGAEAIARRLRQQLPPDTITEEEMTPQQRQARQQAQAMAQAAQQLDMETKQAERDMKAAQAVDYRARAQESQARALQAFADIEMDGLKTSSDIDSQKLRDSLEALKTLNELSNDQGGDNGG